MLGRNGERVGQVRRREVAGQPPTAVPVFAQCVNDLKSSGATQLAARAWRLRSARVYARGLMSSAASRVRQPYVGTGAARVAHARALGQAAGRRGGAAAPGGRAQPVRRAARLQRRLVLDVRRRPGRCADRFLRAPAPPPPPPPQGCTCADGCMPSGLVRGQGFMPGPKPYAFCDCMHGMSARLFGPVN